MPPPSHSATTSAFICSTIALTRALARACHSTMPQSSPAARPHLSLHRRLVHGQVGACKKAQAQAKLGNTHASNWDAVDDQLLIKAVHAACAASNDGCVAHGGWKPIAQQVPGRTERSCIQRWKAALDPTINKGEWSTAEVGSLDTLFEELGPQWMEIARQLSVPGPRGRRTGQACKNKINNSRRGIDKRPAGAAAGRGGAGRGGTGRGAAGDGSAHLRATAQVTDDTLLSDLSSALVTGSRIGATIALQLPTATGMSTCGELADMEPAAAAKIKIVRFPHVLALRAALRRRLRDGEPTDGGSGSGAGGMADVVEGGATAPASDSPEVASVTEAAGAASGAEVGHTVCGECCIQYATAPSTRPALMPSDATPALHPPARPARQRPPLHCVHCLRRRYGEHDTSYTARDGHSWFDTADGSERCGRCHYLAGNEALFSDDSASETDEDEEAIDEANVGTDEGTDDESGDDDDGCESDG